jgi:hypothetical protein
MACSAMISPKNTIITGAVGHPQSTSRPMWTMGTEWRAEPNRTQLRRSTLRMATLPIRARSDGGAPSSGRSSTSRCAGTAAISECTCAFTSVHHAAPLALAPLRSVTLSSSGIMRSDFT